MDSKCHSQKSVISLYHMSSNQADDGIRFEDSLEDYVIKFVFMPTRENIKTHPSFSWPLGFTPRSIHSAKFFLMTSMYFEDSTYVGTLITFFE